MSTRTNHRLPGMTCPDCGGPATQRKGRGMSAIVREVAYRCDDDACGTGFVSQIETIRITQRSARPNPENHLPFVPHARLVALARTAVNDDIPRPANDDAPRDVGPAHDYG